MGTPAVEGKVLVGRGGARGSSSGARSNGPSAVDGVGSGVDPQGR